MFLLEWYEYEFVVFFVCLIFDVGVCMYVCMRDEEERRVRSS